jgi:hypothetical protein
MESSDGTPLIVLTTVKVLRSVKKARLAHHSVRLTLSMNNVTSKKHPTYIGRAIIVHLDGVYRSLPINIGAFPSIMMVLALGDLDSSWKASIDLY